MAVGQHRPWGVEDGGLVFGAAASRGVDRACADEFGLPAIVLMENAAVGLAGVCFELLAGVARPRVVIACGPGNNGGDGLALARHLVNGGAVVRVVLGFDPEVERMSAEAGVHLRVARAMGIGVIVGVGEDGRMAARRAIGEADLIVDALLGTGVSRPVSGGMAALIGEINERAGRGVLVLSVDVPSGLDAETGMPVGGAAGVAVRATHTAALGGWKPGMLRLDAQGYIGKARVVGIGAPAMVLERFGTAMPGPVHDRAEAATMRSCGVGARLGEEGRG